MERVWDGNTLTLHLLRSAVLAAFAIRLGAAVAAPAADDNTIVVEGNRSFDDLPAGLERRIPVGLAPTEVAAILAGQPNLVVRGRLIVTPAGPGLPRVLAVNSLELADRGEILTGGNDIQIMANKIKTVGGRIAAFPADDDPRPAPEGVNGDRGQDAGSVVLSGAIDGSGLLRVNLVGQSGHVGGNGVKAPPGPPGARGNSAVDHLFDCAHGGGDGGSGLPGGVGGNGGAGGNGGNGGLLILRGPLVSQRQQIDFVAKPGKGAKGGVGGAGGEGGQGGTGGSGSTYCSGGNAGPSGPPGPAGSDGPPGLDGVEGRIVAD